MEELEAELDQLRGDLAEEHRNELGFAERVLSPGVSRPPARRRPTAVSRV